ncbi:MAG: aldose 1-epimerase family protein [Bacteroides sp.]|nr:aldose 1-epimerase family protein [Bacteroides sp.]MCM1379827.1 aldose 1-epimerase family protein [Bacteroides sp.]MCM1446186.1 aldose 1-epimerase family protein [Prevotella sp.]
MSYIELHNGPMQAKINTLGAELVSLKKNGNEYLWQGDLKYWHGQSPLLFPTCGNCWNGTYRIDSQEYSIEKHGFARHMEFDIVSQTDSTVTLALHSDDDTLKVYPYTFFLFVTYRLGDSDIEVEWLVQNQNDGTMYFGIGAHPAFFLPDYDTADSVHGFFSFDTNKPITYLLPKAQGCADVDDPQTLQLDEQGMMPITSTTFDIDTYILESADVHRCTLLTPERVPYLAVDFSMPVLSLWSPTAQHPDCPFVAIEPWYGSCDSVGFSGDISERRHINVLDPGAHFRTSYKIILF